MPTRPQHDPNSPIHLNDLELQEPLHSTLNLPTALEDTVPIRVGQQELIPHEYIEALNADGDFENTYPGPMLLGASGDNEWIGRLNMNWNGTYTYARALASEAIGDPMLSAWPKYLQLELVVGFDISTLDIQAWIRQTEATVVRLGYTPGTDNSDRSYFENLIQTLRNARGYAIVKWENRGRTLDRLLFAPLGKFLVCVAFPEDGVPNRPVRVINAIRSHPESRRRKLSEQG